MSSRASKIICVLTMTTALAGCGSSVTQQGGTTTITGPSANINTQGIQNAANQYSQDAQTLANSGRNALVSADNAVNSVANAQITGPSVSLDGVTGPRFRIINGKKYNLISKTINVENPIIYPAKGGFLDCPIRGFRPFYKTGWTFQYVLHLKLSSLHLAGYQAFGDEISVPVTTDDSWNSFIDFQNCSGYGLVAHWRKDTLNTGKIFIDYTFYANNAGVNTEISKTNTVEVDETTGKQVGDNTVTIDSGSIQPGLQLSADVTVTPGQDYKQIYYQNKNHPHYMTGNSGFGGGFPGESGFSGNASGRYIDESVRPETGGVGPMVK